MISYKWGYPCVAYLYNKAMTNMTSPIASAVEAAMFIEMLVKSDLGSYFPITDFQD